MNLAVKVVLALIFAFSAEITSAQQPDLEKGIDLYKTGDFVGAISKLNGSTDPTALHYLGLAFERINKPKDAAKAYEKSFKTGYEVYEQKLADRLDISIKTEKESFSDFLKNLVPTIELSIASAHRAVSLKANMARQYEWLIKANSLVAVVNLAKSGETIYAYDEVATDAKITSKPRPNYTDSARGNNVSGTVILLVVLASDGMVTFAKPVEPLPSGLTDEALLAVKKIKFEPATKNGHPVSVAAKIEYTFSIR